MSTSSFIIIITILIIIIILFTVCWLELDHSLPVCECTINIFVFFIHLLVRKRILMFLIDWLMGYVKMNYDDKQKKIWIETNLQVVCLFCLLCLKVFSVWGLRLLN